MVICAMAVYLLLYKVEERRNIVLHNKGIYDKIEREDTMMLRTNVKEPHNDEYRIRTTTEQVKTFPSGIL